jgi:hypothetical protein
MRQEDSSFRECKIFSPVRNTPPRHERPLAEAMKTRSRWPFTVTAGLGAMPLAEDRRSGPGNASSFVT